MRIHILDEVKSPPDSMLWTMLCGFVVIVEESGDLIPQDIDFYLRWADEVNCEGCRQRLHDDSVDVKRLIKENA
jgi:hypothetical protein